MSEEIKLNILKDILGSHHNESGGQTVFFCPKCNPRHHKRKLSINIEKGFFKCWVCDWSGRDLYPIVKKYGKHSQKVTWRDLTSKVEISDFKDKLFGLDEVEEEKVKLELPKGFVSLTRKNLPHNAIYPMNYLHDRGLSKQDILKWKIGYCSEGEFGSRIIIPSFDLDGDLSYFIARTYGDDWRRYMNPKASKDIIFNHLYLDFEQDLTIVEGVFDAIKAGDNSVPLLGSTLTENSKLFKEIVENKTNVYLALDKDAHKKALKILRLLVSYDINVKFVDLQSFSDVGDMSKEEFQMRKDHAVQLDGSNFLMNKIINI